MASIKAKPAEGLVLDCSAIEQNGSRRPRKAGGYVSEQIHEAVRAHCWYRQISQSDFVAGLVVAHLEHLQQSGQLTPNIIDLYRNTRL